jgi:hypothetical protein
MVSQKLAKVPFRKNAGYTIVKHRLDNIARPFSVASTPIA